jgi:hypothetical protein
MDILKQKGRTIKGLAFSRRLCQIRRSMVSTSRIMIELLLRVRGVFSGTLKKKLGLTLAFAKEERGRVCFRRRLHSPADVAMPLGLGCR